MYSKYFELLLPYVIPRNLIRWFQFPPTSQVCAYYYRLLEIKNYMSGVASCCIPFVSNFIKIRVAVLDLNIRTNRHDSILCIHFMQILYEEHI
jgi:hypothetical protein